MTKFTRMIFGTLIIFLSANLAYSEECKKIVVSGDPEYPPFTWKDKNNNKLWGTFVELLEKAFSELNLPVEAKYVGNWARAQLNARRGAIDILAGPIYTEERAVYMDYVFPEFSIEPKAVFVMKSKAFPFEKWEDLIGMSGGGPLGFSYGDKFDAFAKEKLYLLKVSKTRQLFKMLELDRLNYVILGLYSGLIEAKKIGFAEKVEYLPKYLSSDKLFVAFSKKSPCKKYLGFLSQKSKEYRNLKTHEKLVPKYLTLWNNQRLGK